MPNEPRRTAEQDQDGTLLREDEPIPSASDDKVLEETARLAREGLKERESDPRERKPQAE